MENGPVKCEGCSENYTGNSNKIRCSHCCKYYHPTCAFLKDVIIEIMSKSVGLKWFCASCEEILEKKLAQYSAIERENSLLKDLIKELKSSNKLLKEKLEIGKIQVNDEPKNSETESYDDPDGINPAETSLSKELVRKELVTNKNDIEKQRQNSNEAKKRKIFEALKIDLNFLERIYEVDYDEPSKIQKITLPALLASPSQNVIILSRSLTTKIEALVLAMLSKVDVSKKYPQILCFSYNDKLAVKTGEVAANMAKFFPEIKIKYEVKEEVVPEGTKFTEHIIIGTPEKMKDWAYHNYYNLQDITVFVLEGIDLVSEYTCNTILKCISRHNKSSSKCQKMFFFAAANENVMEFAQTIVKNPIITRLKRVKEILDNTQQYFVNCGTEKYKSFISIYRSVCEGLAIIFCKNYNSAMWLSQKMSEDGHSVAVDRCGGSQFGIHHRNAHITACPPEEIVESSQRYGCDMKKVTMVVNYDLPMDLRGRTDYDTYLNRIGLAGGFGKSGIAISLVDCERTFLFYKYIEERCGREIQYLHPDDSDELEKIRSRIKESF